MHETLILAMSWGFGGVLGVIFFAGLWWTLRKGLSSKRPALWFFGSTWLRMSIVVTGLYFVGHGHWERLALCLVGFIMARMIVMCLTRPEEHRKSGVKAVSHAP